MAVPAPDRDRLHSTGSDAADLLTAAGVGRWEVFTKLSSTHRVSVAPGTPPEVVDIDEMGVAARSHRAGRAGFGAASGAGSGAARRAVEGALASEMPWPHDPLPPARLLGVTEASPCRQAPPQGWSSHVIELLSDALTRASLSALGLRRAVVEQGSFGWQLRTTDGFVAEYHGSTTSLLAEVQLQEKQAGVWREWSHIPDPGSFDPDGLAQRIVNRALLTRHRVTTDSGLRDVILDPEVSARLLSSLSPLFLAGPSEHDRLPNLVDRDGRLAAPALTVVDDRGESDVPVVGPCDGEGFPARRTLLLDEGVPRHRLASYRDAIAYGETPRGGALRLSYRDYPATGIANLRVLTRTPLAPSELLEAADRALYLVRPLAPVILDAARDSYRIIASGVWLRACQVRGWHPVVELGGSLTRLLRRIEGVGGDQAWFQTEHGCVGAPSLLIRRQPVVG